ncbi:MAG: hypothetical protein ACLFV7_03705 [Phycisphaerae bacterium]
MPQREPPKTPEGHPAGEVEKWIGDRSGRVLSCHAVPRGIGIALFFVPAAESFDFDLADELVGLSANLVRHFNVGPVEIHQIPQDELERFVPPKTAWTVYECQKTTLDSGDTTGDS